MRTKRAIGRIGMTVYRLNPGHRSVREHLVRQQLAVLVKLQSLGIQNEEASVLATDADNFCFVGLTHIPFEKDRRAAEVDVAIGWTIITLLRHLKEGLKLAGFRIKRKHTVGIPETWQLGSEWRYR